MITLFQSKLSSTLNKKKAHTSKLPLEELLEKFVEGTTVYSQSISESLSIAYDSIKDGGYIASIPTFIQLRNILPYTHTLWQNNYDGASLEYTDGVDSQGTFLSKGEPAVIVTHNLRLPTLKHLSSLKSAEKRLTRGIPYTQKTFDELISGTTPEGEPISLYHYEDFMNETKVQNKRFGIVLPRELCMDELFFGQEAFVNHPYARARSGVPEEILRVYASQLRENLSERVFLPENRFVYMNEHAHTEPAHHPEARLLYVSDTGIQLGMRTNHNPHRFLVAKR